MIMGRVGVVWMVGVRVVSVRVVSVRGMRMALQVTRGEVRVVVVKNNKWYVVVRTCCTHASAACWYVVVRSVAVRVVAVRAVRMVRVVVVKPCHPPLLA